MAEVTAIRELTDEEALASLRERGKTTMAAAALARQWGWNERKAQRKLDDWETDGLIRRRGKQITVLGTALIREPDMSVLVKFDIKSDMSAMSLPVKTDTKSDIESDTRNDMSASQPGRSVAVRNAAQDAATVAAPESPYVARLLRFEPPPPPQSARHTWDAVAYVAAVALAGAAAFFSIKGMVVLFPGSPMSVIVMAIAMEAAKLVTAGWLARRWRSTAWFWRLVLVAPVAGLAVINAAGVYAQLVAAHVGDRGAATSAIETQDAALAAKIDVQAHKVADLDRRLGQIDSTIEEAAKRGRTNAALSAMEGQRKARGALVDERNREAGTLAAIKAERASLSARGKQIETEAAPIRYVAELLGVDTDSERAIRWLIALMVLCCDPLAIALTAAASARR